MKDNSLDFPFYNDNPKINMKDIVILLSMPILFTIYTFLPFEIPFGLGPYVFFIAHLLAFLYVARGNISLLIKKPKFKDFLRVIGTLILQYIVAVGIVMILKNVFNVATTENGVFEMEMNISFWFKIIFQLFGEELYKILIFLAVLTLMYKKTKKRTLSISIALTISLLFFAFLHMTTYNNIIQILLVQGLATLCCFYNYLKTKNILMSYLQHLLYDAIPFILSMLIII